MIPEEITTFGRIGTRDIVSMMNQMTGLRGWTKKPMNRTFSLVIAVSSFSFKREKKEIFLFIRKLFRRSLARNKFSKGAKNEN